MLKSLISWFVYLLRSQLSRTFVRTLHMIVMRQSLKKCMYSIVIYDSSLSTHMALDLEMETFRCSVIAHTVHFNSVIW